MMKTARHSALFAIVALATLMLILSGAHGASTFTVDAQRSDPYKNYRFQLVFDDRPVGGFDEVDGLTKDSDVANYREGETGSGAQKIPGSHKYGDVTLKRGVIGDSDFWNWLKNARRSGRGKDLTIVLRDETGNPVQRFTIKRVWVSDSKALPDLDAGGNAIAIEHIKLENEGWEQDTLTPGGKR